MYQSNRSLNIPPGIARAFDVFSCPRGREFDELPGGGAFDHYSLGVGNLIASLDFILRVALIPRGVINPPGGILYGEAPPRASTPYPFIYHFGRKVTPFIYLLLKKGTPFTYLL